MRRGILVGFVLSAIAIPLPASAQAPPLDVAIVIEVAPDPIVGTDGRPLAGAGETLERLTEVFDRLDRTEQPLALSVSPVLVSQLRLLGPTGAQSYATLLRLASTTPVLTRPFADVQLPHLSEAADLTAQLRLGTSSLRRALNVDPLPILHPPLLDLSDHVLDVLGNEPPAAVLGPADALRGRAVRSNGVPLLPTDRIVPIETTLAADILARNRAPVVVVLDALDPRLDELSVIPGDDRFNLVGIGDLIGSAPDGVARFGQSPQPPAAYTEAVGRAAASLEAFTSYTLDENPIRETLEVLLGLAASSAHWIDRWDQARALAAFVVDRVSEERDLIFASQGSVTLTSQRGTVPVTVINLARYPVRLRVSVTSPKLAFPEGATKVLTATPQGDTITFVAQARAPGTFPMVISVTSPDGNVRFGSSEVLVRSIAARTPALVLTAGAAAFLLAWSARSLLRRRRSRGA